MEVPTNVINLTAVETKSMSFSSLLSRFEKSKTSDSSDATDNEVAQAKAGTTNDERRPEMKGFEANSPLLINKLDLRFDGFATPTLDLNLSKQAASVLEDVAPAAEPQPVRSSVGRLRVDKITFFEEAAKSQAETKPSTRHAEPSELNMKKQSSFDAVKQAFMQSPEAPKVLSIDRSTTVSAAPGKLEVTTIEAIFTSDVAPSKIKEESTTKVDRQLIRNVKSIFEAPSSVNATPQTPRPVASKPGKLNMDRLSLFENAASTPVASTKMSRPPSSMLESHARASTPFVAESGQTSRASSPFKLNTMFPELRPFSPINLLVDDFQVLDDKRGNAEAEQRIGEDTEEELAQGDEDSENIESHNEGPVTAGQYEDAASSAAKPSSIPPHQETRKVSKKVEVTRTLRERLASYNASTQQPQPQYSNSECIAEKRDVKVSKTLSERFALYMSAAEATTQFSKPSRDIQASSTISSARSTFERKAAPASIETLTVKSTVTKRFVPVAQPSCTVCSKSVYPLELLVMSKKPYHKNCLRCEECNCLLRLNSMSSVGGKWFCKPHFIRKSREAGRHYENEAQ